MKIFLQHRAWKIGIALLILLVTQMSGEGTQKASADIAPPGPPLGDGLSPSSENTNVRMMWEYVLLDIDGNSSYYSGEAHVTAEFQMRNLGDVAEQMRVRFPLSTTMQGPGIEEPFCTIPPTYYEPIEGFTVWVNDVEVVHEVEYETLYDRYESWLTGDSEEVYTTVPCWAHFDVTFPPGQDVNIKIFYIVEGYDHGAMGESDFIYVLRTGAGWRDTIGEATIVARLPYELNETNFLGCVPDDCVVSGTEVTWHYEDFEPDSNIFLDIINPNIWMDILAERENVMENPNDGEAWGRLGRAYNYASYQSKGIISPYGQPYEELYNLSVEAYTNAVTLLPDDADWHYHFANLLCNRAMHASEDTFEIWYPCAEQLNLGLQINPEDEWAHDLLGWFSHGWAPSKFIRTDGSAVDFVILTPGVTFPTDTPTRTRVPALTVWQPNTPTPGEPGSAYQIPQQWWADADPTAENTPTTSPSPEPQSTPTHPSAATATSTPASLATPAPSSSSTPIFIGAGVLLLALVLVVTVIKGRRM